jgi:putative nucleotidyltransferase with HDIG domain
MKKILIVDDNPQNLYFLEIMLLSNSFEVRKAANGKEALEFARKEIPDLVITDILMPVMDGFSLCRELKTDKDLKNIPLIFYTATYTDPRDEEFAMSLGADRFLVKPMDPTEMLKVIREVMLSSDRILKPIPVEQAEDEKYYKSYSETLVRKLEGKMLQLERANKRQKALYQASCEMIKLRTPDEIIQMVLRTIIETAGYQQANYFQYYPSDRLLKLTASFGFSHETQTKYRSQLEFKIGEEKGLVGKVAETLQVINIADTTVDPRWIVLDETIQAALFIPVVFEKRMSGVMGLFSREKDAFGLEDLQNVTALANSLAVAIENCEKETQVQHELKNVSALHNIDVAINSNIDLRTTLKAILQISVEQLAVDAADIVLFNPYSLAYDFAAGFGFKTNMLDEKGKHERLVLAERVIMDRRLVHERSENRRKFPPALAELWEKEQAKGYWGVPLIVRGEIRGVLEVVSRRPFDPGPDWLAYLETLAGQTAIAIDSIGMREELQRSNIDLRVAYDATIEGWSKALDLRDNETENHTQRVMEMSLKLAEKMGIKNEDLIHIKRGALLHDIGKMGVPDHILHKPGPLTDEEWVIMKQHPQFAYEMLSPISYLHRALDIPGCHHEKWNGTGYPRGLKGEQIPLAARLFAVVDVWDALRSDRPYRKAWPDEKVMAYIKEESGKHFDPNVVDNFLEVLQSEIAKK